MVWAPGWKEKVIRFVSVKCKRCGRCCTGYELMALNTKDLQRLCHHFHANLETVMVRFCAEHPGNKGSFILNKSKPCQFYKNGCRIYNARPIGCRFYPMLTGGTMLCEKDEIEVPDMEDQALWIALVKTTGLSVTEMMSYLKSMGVWVDDGKR
jgi:Fe-S-cluster containining protein